ncbi:MAG: PKD domain-containing protein [Chloroflexi bacterium]|nr:PKD domain-containing protein [Chloroflexota bacterium]
MKRSRSFHSRNPLSGALCVLTLILMVYPTIASAANTLPNGLETAWERARDIGTYDFTADIEQTLIPRPLPSMIGETDQRVDIRIEGSVTLPDYARMRLQFEGAGLDTAPVELVQDGTETFLIRDGERTPIDNPSALSSPTADYLGYLAAAENVQTCESTNQLDCYAFDVNGARFAEYVRDQLQTQIDETSTLNGDPVPPNTTLSPAPLLQRMSGHGELFIDKDGLPRRQVLDLTITRTSDEYDAQVRIVVDYQFSKSITGQSDEWTNAQGDQSTNSSISRSPNSPASKPDLLFLAISIAFFCGLIVYRRHRWVYATFAVSLSLMMTLTPVLQALGVAQFQARQAQAAPIQTLTEAMGLSTEQSAPSHESRGQPLVAPNHASRFPAASSNDNADLVCGDGNPNKDEDNDGLNDAAENCLGTDPYHEDSDRDTITDTIEVDGFEYGGRTWVSDPFKADANDDGLVDYGEWPAPVGEAPELDDVDDWDPDGDNTPNLWDDDNDGDSIPDYLDMSAFSRTAYSETFSLLISRGDYDGHQYIEFQIQPQNPDHLRYSRSVLDWPYDEKGQIQDLDNSEEDVRMFPMLKVRTDQIPERTLARRYGVSTFEKDDETYLHIPLVPQGDGGQIVTFYAKIAYGPDVPQTIEWESAELIWIAQMPVDRDTRHGTVTDDTPIATYPGGDFRIAGFQVTKSTAFESVVFGTPSVPDDDRHLFNLAFGVSATFLHNQKPELETIVTRFDNSNTDIVETWGVTSTLVSVDSATSSHADAGIADLATRIPDFLDAHYTSAMTPSLVIAYQQEMGVYKLDQVGQYEPDGNLNINLADVVANTQRSAKLTTYRYDDGWEAFSLQETIDHVEEKYDNDEIEQDLEELQDDYPELDEEDLRGVLILFYTVWFVGQTRIITVDGQDLAPESRSDREVYDDFSRAESGLSAYLIEAGSLGKPGGGLRIGQSMAETWAYQRDEEMKESVIGVVEVSNAVLGGGGAYFTEVARRGAMAGIRIVIAILSAKTVFQAASWARDAGAWLGKMKILDNAEHGGRVLGALGMVVGIAFAWTYFGLTTDFSNPISIKYGVTLAILSTAFSILLFAISLNPIGAVFAMLFSIADVFVIIFTGKSIVQHLSEAIYHANNLSNLDDADFRDFDSGPADPDIGIIVGNSFLVTAEFVGKIELTSDGGNDDLQDSWVDAFYKGITSQANVASRNGIKDCSISEDTKTCTDPVGTEYQFTSAGRDIKLTVKSSVEAKTLYEECVFGVCKNKSLYSHLPRDLAKEDQWDPMEFYLDVLPGSLDGLWNWSAITNPDSDGDELTDAEEIELGTDPNDWDSDDDTLSDKFEYDNQDNLGTDPLDPDSDDDGLSDGFEHRHGTTIDAVDSDDDGLDDNEEVYHIKVFTYDHGSSVPMGTWLGGWVISTTQTTTATVFSDPTLADADGDDLNDASERNNRTSPYAYNDAPRLTLDTTPLATSPSGNTAAYVEPSDTVAFTLTLESVGPQAITSTLTLCFPDFLTNVSGGNLTGDPPASHIPPKQVNPSDCANGGMAWDFAAEHTLQKWETVSTTITADISSSVSSSISGTVTTTLPYPVTEENGDIVDQVNIIVDVDDPDVVITAPEDGALIGGGISSYVIGGASSDETSWVDRVEIDLPAGGGTVTANEVSPWAYTWSLPPDGEYTLSARAYDYIGRVSLASTVAITVDNTAPTITLSVADGAIVTGQSGARTITVTLSGTGTDNLAGLKRIQISIDERPWREVWVNPGNGAILTTNWSDEWVLPNDDSSQGTHAVALRALDRAGNESGTLERTIIVDVQPPTDELVHRSYTADPPPHIVTGQSLELHGVANDVGNAPQPSRPAELIGELDSLTDATIWLGLSDVSENDDGVRVAWLGDFNGDRLADLVVGLPNAEDGAGRAALVYGRAGDWPIPSNVEALADTYTSLIGGPGDKLGDVLAPAGDVDGDGLADLLLGDPVNNSAHVIFGHTSPLGRNVAVTQTARHVTLTAPKGQIGQWLGTAGDVNGDGFDDMLIGATSVPTTYLILGQESGLWWEPTDLDFYAAATIATSASGARVTGVGDMDDDQYDEFIVADGDTVYLFTGHEDFTPMAGETLELTDAHATFTSTETRPTVVALGDVNDDDLADFIYADGDTPVIVLGDAGRNWVTHSLDSFSPAPSGFLAAPGDVNADGIEDILVGNSADDAYLILGNALDTIQATLTSVDTAASAPYAAGADLNSDGSSDLVVVPTAEAAAKLGMYSPDFGETPRIDPSFLSRASILPSEATRFFPKNLVATLTVDDDGGANYTTIQAAINAASDGDTIQVQSGVYAAFTINNKDNLTISGIHADAVFVDGAGGDFVAKIQNADGVRLENLTLRDATNGVVLDDAGVNGYTTPTLKITLDTLLVYDFVDHAVTMNRISTADLVHCTLVSGGSSGTHVAVTGSHDPAIDAAWSTISTDSRATTTGDGDLVAGNDGRLYIMPDRTETQIDIYAPDADTWSSLADAPLGYNAGTVMDGDAHLWSLRAYDLGGFASTVHAIGYISENEIYVGGNFLEAPGNPDAAYIAMWDGYRWHRVGSGGPDDRVYAITVDGSDVYVGGRFGIMRWNGSNWTNLGTVSGREYNRSGRTGDDWDVAVYAIAVNGDDVYVGGNYDDIGDLHAHSFARYNSGWHWVGEGATSFRNGVSQGDMHAMVAAFTKKGDDLYVGGDGQYILTGKSGDCSEQFDLTVVDMTTNYFGCVTDRDHWYRNHIYALAILGDDILVGGQYKNDSNYTNDLSLYRPSSNSWSYPSYLHTTGQIHTLRTDGNKIWAGGDPGKIGGSTVNKLGYYDGSAWHAIGSGVNGRVHGLVYVDNAPSGDGVTYIVGSFTEADGDAAIRVARWDGTPGSSGTWKRRAYLYEYDGANWQSHRVPERTVLGYGSGLSWDGGYLYVVEGGGSKRSYRYTISSHYWVYWYDLPDGVGKGSALAWANEYLYVLRGGGTQSFYRYGPQGWENRTTLPYITDAGAGLTWDGNDWLYATFGGNGKQFARYHIPSNRWETLGDGSSATTDDHDTPTAVNAGGGLVSVSHNLYGIPGSDVAEVWRYDPVGLYFDKLSLDQVAFVAPPNATDATWYDIEGVTLHNWNYQPDDFRLDGTQNTWIGSSAIDWTPDNNDDPPLGDSSEITYDDADFVDAARDVYRPSTLLDSGYHAYRVPAVVAPSGEEFTSIQAAIDSGANRVIVKPGVYEEPFYLLSGVEVIGAGADRAIIQAPVGSTDPLVVAEGVSGASLSRLTLDGNGESVTGFYTEDNAQAVRLARAIVRDAQTGIHVTGSDTDVEVVNNTIVENADGMIASSCAPVDVRNTIFAHHTGTGLAYEGCAATKLHTYNLYWDNTTNITPDETGPAELFLDPLFIDPLADDYRTEDISPVVDAGNPTDPAPPGTGGRVDIGYVEQGRAAFYADDDYCDTCINDGLTWQVDAFDTIQNALDQTPGVLETPRVSRVAVGVGPGTYLETLTIPSHVRLLAVDADKVTIDAGGSGTAITLDGVTDVEINGFTLTNADRAVSVRGASNAITITRNLITNNTGGIEFDERATGLVNFNTLANNSSYGIRCNETGTWADAHSNILVENGTALRADGNAQLFSDYNLFYHNSPNYNDVAEGDGDLTNQYPRFSDGYHLRPDSRAVDAASPFADVPVGGGLRADMGYKEVLAAPVTLFLGKEDLSTVIGNSGVMTVEVGVTHVLTPSDPVTATTPSSWNTISLDSPQETVSYWHTALTPTQTGLYRFYTRAADVAGNQELDNDARRGSGWYDGAFVADSQPPTVTWLSPVSGTATTSPLELRAQVSDYVGGDFNVTQIHFEAGGQTYAAEWAAEPWDEDSGDPHVLRAWVTLANLTYSDVIAVAEDRAGNVGQSAPIELGILSQTPADTTPPLLTVASPANGAWFTAIVPFSGTVSDDDSGVASVEVSVDGGYTWIPAQTGEVSETSQVSWTLTWQASEKEDTIFESYPVHIRTTDRTGNETEDARILGIDTQPPTPPRKITFRDHDTGDDIPPGYHFDEFVFLDLAWRDPVDTSGFAETLLAVDQFSNTMPAQVMTNTNATVSFHALGEWYIHFAGHDSAGNMSIRHYGPWYVGTFAASAVSFSERRQTILIDGLVDLPLNEWRIDTEFLDDDETDHRTQSLYSTWDGSGLYMAWDGAWWSVAGNQWTYIDVIQPGGTSQPITPITGVLETLPIAADYAIRISSPTSGTLWAWETGAWQEQPSANWQFALGDTGGAEIYLPMNTSLVNSMQIMALAEEDSAPWSVFPTTNRLVEPWTDIFQWDALDVTITPNDEQKWFNRVDMVVNYYANYRDFGSPGDDVAYLINLVNLENHPVENLRLLLEAGTGIFYTAVDADDCLNCPAGGDVWEIGVTTIEAGDSRLITVTGQLSATLGAITTITNNVTLSSTTPTSLTLAQGPIVFRVDGLPPTVSLQTPPGEVVGTGVQALFGTATDAPGGGVDFVEYRVNGGAWQTARGSETWAASIDVLTGTTALTVEVRATDIFSQTGEPVSITLGVDTIPPTLTFGLPSVLTGNYGNIGGIVSDTTPLGDGLVEQVAVQIDGTGDWQPAQVYPPGSPQGWSFPWQLPPDDGVFHTLCISVTDFVGNALSPNPCYDVFVDTIAPMLSITQQLTQVALLDSLVVLSGTIADGSGVEGIDVWLYNPAGAAYTEATTTVGDQWVFVPGYTEPVTGDHALWVEATDTSGNSDVQGPFIISMTEQTIAGLTATASPNPTLVDNLTTLNASVEAGSNITYTWDFGDGQQSSPILFSTVVHTYSTVGNYTAIVTAANSVSEMTTTVAIKVSNVVATNNGPTRLGDDTQFIALTADITPMTYAWDFGNGLSSGSNPAYATLAHVYTQTGIYTATVTVTDTDGGLPPTLTPYTATTVVIVDEPITGLIAVNNSPTHLGDATTFTATIVSGTNVLYTWNWGDVSLVPGGNDEGSPITHTYLLPGVYTVTVTAQNSVSAVVTSTLVIIDQAIAGLGTFNDGPTPLNDVTTLAASIAAGSNVVYTWNPGDGSGPLVGQIVTHTYPSTGTYTAIVTATNSVSTDVSATTVIVDEAITGLSAADNGPTVLSNATAFTATIASGSRVAYAWAFDDGGFGSGTSLTHTYAAARTYTAIITASNSVSVVTATSTVDVDEPITDPLALNDGPTPLGAATTLSATVGAGSRASYTWTLGDGGVGGGTPLTHTYPSTGTFTAIVTASNGASSITTTTVITVDEVITGLVALADGPTSLGAATHLTVTTSAGSRISYTWALGNGTTDSGTTITYTYPTTGTYTAVVTAANSVSTITATATITVDKAIARLVAFNDSPTGFGTPTTLTATVGAGSRVIYTWTLGDGTVDSGNVVTYTYPAVMTYTATVTAFNSTSSLSTTTTVVITNHAPVILPIGYQQVTEDELLSFTVIATDTDGPTPVLSASGVPTGANFITGTGLFEWTPDHNAAGAYTVTFGASDGVLTDTEIMSITVTDLSRWPVLNPIGDKWIAETETLTFSVTASDPDGITPTLSASDVPTGASFITKTGIFNWTPNYGTSGVYAITFNASDGILIDTEIIAVTVSDTTPPTIVDTSPADGTSDVVLNAPIIVNFSEAMLRSTVNIAITPNITGISKTWSLGDTRLTMDHNNLTANTRYTSTITGSDHTGHPLAAPYTWVFTTGMTIAPETDLALAKVRDGSGVVTAGQRITYTFIITNNGPTTPVTATITDFFSNTAALVRVGGVGCEWATGTETVTCTVTRIISGTPQHLTLVVTSCEVFSGTLSNIATIAPIGGIVDTIAANDTAGPVLVVVRTESSAKYYDIYLPLVLRDFSS